MDETHVYEQMTKRIDLIESSTTIRMNDIVRRLESEAQTSKEFRRDVREKLHKLKGSLGTAVIDITNHLNDINQLKADTAELKTDHKEALGQEGWVLKRLGGQDAKWTRIYFLIISLLLSIITLTVTLWLTSKSGK